MKLSKLIELVQKDIDRYGDNDIYWIEIGGWTDKDEYLSLGYYDNDIRQKGMKNEETNN